MQEQWHRLHGWRRKFVYHSKKLGCLVLRPRLPSMAGIYMSLPEHIPSSLYLVSIVLVVT